MNKEKLRILIENGRKEKKLSQRELARRIKISHSSLNSLEKGEVQKPDVEILINIAKELELSSKEVLKVAGYEKLLYSLTDDIDGSNI